MSKAAKTPARKVPAAKAKSVAATAAWPQARTSGSAVGGHAGKPIAVSHQSGVPAGELPRSYDAVTTWLTPWGQMSATATRMIGPEALLAAIDRQFHLVQSMARLSPLTLALQMMHGMLPDARHAGAAKSAHRS